MSLLAPGQVFVMLPKAASNLLSLSCKIWRVFPSLISRISCRSGAKRRMSDFEYVENDLSGTVGEYEIFSSQKV
jgi:hypothetical protein